MRALSDVLKEIKKSKLDKEKIEGALNLFSEKIFQLSTYDFMMNYYNIIVFLSENEFEIESRAYFDKVDVLIKKIFEDKTYLEGETKEELLSLREELRVLTERATVLMSALENYQYALERKKSSVDIEMPENLDDYARDILGFLFESEDAFVTNVRIAETLKCLPIRYTKEKFLDLVSAGFDKYLGSNQLSLKSLLYHIRIASMLDVEKGEITSFKEIESFLLSLKEVDIKKMSEHEGSLVGEEVREVIFRMNQFLEDSRILMDCVNALTSMFRTRKEEYWYALSKEMDCIRLILKAKEEISVFSEEYEEKIDETLNLFVEKMEDLIDETTQIEAILDTLSTDSKAFLTQYGLLDKVQMLKEILLIRSNPFLVKDELADEELVDNNFLKKMKEEVRREFEELFKEYKQPLRRAVMASVLGVLPVYFGNRTEVMNYVRSALSSCDNREELKAVVHSIREIRRENDND